MDDRRPIASDVELGRDFNRAASAQLEINDEFPKAELKVTPPRLMGPSPGGGPLAGPVPLLARQEREPERSEPATPLLKPAFAKGSRAGSFRAMFNRKAMEHGEDFDQDR
jgi:hypothetical protein